MFDGSFKSFLREGAHLALAGRVVKDPMKPFLSFRFALCLLIAIAALALLGVGMNSLAIESVAFGTAGCGDSTEVNAPYMRLTNDPQEVAIRLYYRGYGNTALRLTPRICFSQGGFRLNGVDHAFSRPSYNFRQRYNPPYKWCQDLTLDLGKWLRPGDNTLELLLVPADRPDTYSPIIGLAVGAPLFGVHAPQSCFTAIFIGSLLGLFWLLLARKGCDWLTCLIFITACGTYLQGLHAMAPFSYTTDWERHTSYMQFISDHFFRPYDYRGPESWHPPLYYWTGALVAKGVQFLGAFDVWTGLHMLSFFFYVVFLYFGMRSIARLLQGYAYYLALALLAFWPGGATSAGWTFNDVMLYPFYAACFYYTLVWYDTGESRTLAKALAACGLAIMIKSTALVPASILGASVVFKLLCGRCRLGSLMGKKTWIGWLVLAAGILLNLGRALDSMVVFQRFSPLFSSLGPRGPYNAQPINFLSIDISEMLTHPFPPGRKEEPSLWNVLIKSHLFIQNYWRYPAMAACIEALYLTMLAYMIVFIFTLPRTRCISLFPLLAGFLLPLAGSVIYTLWSQYTSAMNSHYVYPALVAIIIVFMLSVQETEHKNWPILYYLGNAVAILFLACSIVFYQLQWRG